MNSKTDNRQDFSPEQQEEQIAAGRPLAMWKIWAIMLGCAIAGATALAPFKGEATLFSRGSYFIFITPAWMIPASAVITQGINLFSGNSVTTSWQSSDTVALSALLLAFLIAPTLLLLNFRKLILHRLQQFSLPEKTTVAGFIIGGVLCLPMFATAPYAAYMQVKVSLHMHRVQTVEANEDATVADLQQIGLQARVFYFVPTAFGGGGHRWKNIPTQEGSRDVTLEDLTIESPVTGKLYGNLFPQLPNRFVLEPTTEDTVLAIASVKYPAIKAIVTPHTFRVRHELD